MDRDRRAKGATATTVALISLGCAKNLVDSEVMLGHLKQSGFTPIGHPEDAEVVIINTCGFIRPAREEAEEHIRDALGLKRRRPGVKIAVVGCHVERERENLERSFPEVDVWLGVKGLDRIADALIGRSFPLSKRTFLYSDASPRLVSTPSTWAYVKISEGCSHRCSFCSIPLIKGPYVSRGLWSLVRETRALSRLGIKEINLISHDTTYYGRDKGRKDGLIRLLERLLRVSGVSWVRLLYCYPEEVTSSLLGLMADEEKLCPYLDIPFQHCDAKLIRRMRRGLDGVRALKLLERIRKRVPKAAVRTSLIVGFPGEGRAEFEALKRFVREAAFDHLGVFTYSPERGTDSFGMGSTVSGPEMERRREELMIIQAEISRRKNASRLGEVHRVLLEGPEAGPGGVWLGRTRFQAPEVDGRVFVQGLPRSPVLPDPMVPVRVTGAGLYDLKGSLVK